MERQFTCRMLSDVEKKNIAILELIRKDGPISRTDISKRLEINMVSISNYVKNYIAKGLVIETGQEASSGGRRPELIDLNPRGGYVVGVSITPEEILGVIADLRIKVIKKIEYQGAYDDGKVIEVVKSVIEQAKVENERIRGIGIGISSIMQVNQEALIETFTRSFSVPAFVAQDAMCAALGEKRLNPDADVYNLLYIYSDIGCGIILQGDIYLGASGDAGEISLSSERLKDKEEFFLKESAYLKPWSSDLGIVAEAKRIMAKGVGTEMVELIKGNFDKLTLQIVIDAARRNDEVANGIIEVAAMNLGLRIAYLVNLINPEVVVIGGGIETAGDLVLQPIKSVIQKFSFEKATQVLTVIPSRLGKDSVSLGAAALMSRELFIKM